MDPSLDQTGIVLDPLCVTKVREIERVRTYWESKLAGRTMPQRKDIAPSELRDLLPIIQIYDVLDGGTSYRVRLLGTRIAAAFDEEPTGRTFDAADGSLLVDRMRQVLSHVAHRHAPVIARAARTAIANRSSFAVESIFLPLSEDGENVTAVLAATVFDKQPYWETA